MRCEVWSQDRVATKVFLLWPLLPVLRCCGGHPETPQPAQRHCRTAQRKGEHHSRCEASLSSARRSKEYMYFMVPNLGNTLFTYWHNLQSLFKKENGPQRITNLNAIIVIHSSLLEFVLIEWTFVMVSGGRGRRRRVVVAGRDRQHVGGGCVHSSTTRLRRQLRLRLNSSLLHN